MFFCTSVFLTALQALLFFTKQETQMTFSMLQHKNEPQDKKDMDLLE